MDSPAVILQLFNADALISRLPDSNVTKGLDWTHPLFSPTENALNPPFVQVGGFIVNVVLGLFAALQLMKLTGSHPSKNLSLLHYPKLALIALYAAANLGLYFTSGIALLLAASAVAILVLLPLQHLEVSYSTVPYAAPLIYWLFSAAYFTIVWAQDAFSKHPIFGSITYQPVVCLLAWSVFILEYVFYQPSFEYDKELLKVIDFFSTITFSWIYPLISKIHVHENIKSEELPEVSSEFHVDVTYAKLESRWNNAIKTVRSRSILSYVPLVNRLKWAKEKPKPLLFKAITQANLFYLSFTVATGLADAMCAMTQPWFLRKLLIFFADYTSAEKGHKPAIIQGFIISALMFAVACIQTSLFQQAIWTSFRILFAVDSSLTYLIYKKAMKLSPHAKKDKPTGDIINHLTTDVSTIKWFYMDLHEFIGTPVRLVIALTLLYRLLGNAIFGGLGCGAILLPCVSYVTSAVYSRYNQLLENKDKRTSFVNELLTTVKSVKFYSWEKPMMTKMKTLRGNELKSTKSVGIYNSFSMFLWDCVPFFLSAATYATFTLIYDTPLTPEIVFPALALFNLLSEPVLTLPRLLTTLVEALTSFDRLTEYLTMDETDEQSDVFHRLNDTKAENVVTIKNTTFLWGSHVESTSSYSDNDGDEEANTESPVSKTVALKDINFAAAKGKLTCIVGKVGAGKTTLLRCILSELPVERVAFSDDSTAERPSVEINGNIAYCPQSPWILNASVKENILFGHRHDPEFYKRTVDACQLASDFKSLPDGDKTIVGEKGISLSGGQKARISLARAVYSRADIYLLDDVLSAVDSHVGKAIIKNVLSPTGIIGDRTKILATNSVSVLNKSDLIYMLSGNSITESGDLETVKERKGALAELIEEFGKQHEDDEDEDLDLASESEETTPAHSTVTPAEPDDEVEETIAEFTGGDAEAVKNTFTGVRRASAVSYSHVYNFDDEQELDENGKPKEKKTGQIEEFVATGGVKLEIIWEYCKACDYRFVLLYILFMVISSLLALGEKYVFTYWSEANARAGHTEYPQYYLSIYIGIGLFKGIFVLAGSFIVWTFCILKGTTYFHDKMANAVMRAPMSFFETTPIGRILNRFTDDVIVLDQHLPWMFIWFFESVLSGAVTFGVIIATIPVMLLLILGLLVLYNYYRGRYIPAARQLRRIIKTAKSPVLSTIQESINGVDTINAFDQSDRFAYKTKGLVNTLVKCQLVAQANNRWLAMRLQFISSVIMLLATLCGTYSLTTLHPINAGLFGFIMTYALGITFILTSLVRSWAEIETQSVSIERMSEYCNLTPEADMIVEDKRPSASWPETGSIKFSDYSCRYRDNLPPVLKNISLSIAAKEKIGIVGRTGAGKSSLTLALFRIIEPINGSIDIDDVDVTKIGLYDLRSHLNIIPQESHVVKGSVRENLDPFGNYTDDKLWKTLELAHLKEHIEQMKTEPLEKEKKKLKKPEELKTKYGLDATLDEGGANLSAGQKQLLSLARALLNDESKILVLDEATASVDVQTDKVIQTTIRSEFKEKTILTIAHRLETVMDSDKVLVLDKGEVKEFDAPQTLLKDTNTIFYLLCKQGGYLKE